ncbi:MAG: hypothetical protein V7L22_20045 [Nostoc sp.]|uniref:hypothetical protein n=1 Tax=Nostoc sp. TaxID=1180 RepID=UPI002FFB0101
MTTKIVDQLLADWKNKIQVVSQNLFDLQELPVYQRLCGSPSFAKVHLTGITAQKVTPALEAMNDLFQYFDLLVQTIDRASRLRQQLPRFLATEEKIDEIKQLLTGTSIHLSVVQTPLAQRELLTVTQQANAIAPAQLLEVMTQAFSVARDAVLAVDAAWTNLEFLLQDAESQIILGQNLAASLNQDSRNELVQAHEAIASLRERVEQDPLGVSAEIDRQLKPLLAQVKLVLEQAQKQQAQIQEKLAIAHNLLEQLIRLHSQSIAAFTESQEKVLYLTKHTPLPQEQINALSQWLTRLQNKLEEGLVSPVMLGLDNWIAKAKEYITVEQQTYTANNTLLQTRRELRGRLDALKAKALARGLIEDINLVDLAQKATQLLYMRPTPLDKASELVSQYEKRLNSQF